jgi:hypothetical protein
LKVLWIHRLIYLMTFLLWFYLFWCLHCPPSWYWGHLQFDFCVILTWLLVLFGLFLIKINLCLFCIFCASDLEWHFSPSVLSWEMIFWDQNLGTWGTKIVMSVS